MEVMIEMFILINQPTWLIEVIVGIGAGTILWLMMCNISRGILYICYRCGPHYADRMQKMKRLHEAKRRGAKL